MHPLWQDLSQESRPRLAELDDLLQAERDILAALPSVGIVSIFGFVIYSNFKSGSTTTDAGNNPFFPPAPSSTNSIVTSILQEIENLISMAAGNAGLSTQGQQVVSGLISALSPYTSEATSEVQAAVKVVQAYDSEATADVKSALNQLFAWASGL